MEPRISNAFLKLKQQALDGLLVSLPANITYLTKYSSRDSYFLICEKENIYFTDSRYIEEAEQGLTPGISLRKINGSVFEIIAEACCSLGLKRLGFESRFLPFAEYAKIKEHLSGRAELIPAHSLIEELRQIKEPQELDKIRQAVAITAEALKYIGSFITVGRKEIEIAGELERFIRSNGASKASFDIIVASGPNSAFPHHITSERKIQQDEPVLIDMGVEYQGYKSDLTRVFFAGKINILARKVYDIVLEANSLAINKIGTAGSFVEIDKAARGFIAANGYAEFFGHNLGHGVGLEVHEEPHVSGNEQSRPQAGMIFTIEPGIYLPGEFGIRIEDMVLVTGKETEVLSGAVYK
jgi:Xaa-Pro aminopeptidase